MFPVSDEDIEKAGYLYNSSLNPAFIPGRYMHLTTPRTWFMQGKVMQIPASVSPHLRIPLFWLSMHNFPEWFYLRLVRQVLRHDGYFVTYFHPWEFYDLKSHPEFKMPFIIKNHSGHELEQRLDRFIKAMKADKQEFITYSLLPTLNLSTARRNKFDFRPEQQTAVKETLPINTPTSRI